MKIAALPFFQHVKWRPDAKELRQFAVAMLIGFFVLGLLSVWRGKGITSGAIVLWGIGAFLAMAAFVPKLNRLAYLAVYLPTSIIGYFVSHILLGLMFFLVITPLGFLLRLMGKDLLQKRRQAKAAWTPVKSVSSEDRYYRQF